VLLLDLLGWMTLIMQAGEKKIQERGGGEHRMPSRRSLLWSIVINSHVEPAGGRTTSRALARKGRRLTQNEY
jgi:hypothetical protein